jgi:hypothetical protein
MAMLYRPNKFIYHTHAENSVPSAFKPGFTCFLLHFVGNLDYCNCRNQSKYLRITGPSLVTSPLECK